MTASKRRPGFVLEVDRSTPPTLFMHGEGFKLERLPAGSRIVYPAEALPTLKDPDGAIRHALEHPVDSKPLRELLFPGMKLTIAFDDISLPLPPMQRPDVRQRVIEAVLDVAAEVGVDDVHLIAALALHRRMTEAELRHALGDRVYDAFAPSGALYNHDAEDRENLAFLGETEQGEEVEINKRAAESDLIVYVNINLVAMDGGHKSTATGLASYRSLRHHHNVRTMQHSRSFMDQHRSELHSSNWRMGKVIRDAGVKIFQIETTLNNDTFPKPFDFLQKREWEWSAKDRATFLASSKALDKTPFRVKNQIFQSILAPHDMTSVHAGEIEAVHELTTAKVHEQQLVHVDGQTDVLTMGLPYICPYNVNSVMNPILVACLGLGYFFNLYRNKPLVREGGVLIMSHPTPWAFNPVHHPSYIDFFEQVLSETTDPAEIEARFEQDFATDPWYVHLYRTSHAYHGVHPFYMWYWGAHALQHLGGVIVVGGEPKAVRRLGFKPASTGFRSRRRPRATSTPTGLARTARGWHGPSSSTTSRHRRCVCRRRQTSTALTGSSTSTGRPSSRPTTPATSTHRCC
ncbi:MAG TPA: lactate racemase domain-containing protein [Mycobacteriales bacterium]|nr:lactate racemase domain-containing protein [Mycobacteriales bacterium]